MNTEQTFRLLMIAGALIILPTMIYHRLKAGTGERLDRRQEGIWMLVILRPVGLAIVAAIGVYLVNPAAMAWSATPFPVWVRWAGIALGAADALFLFWTVHTLGPNLTDTVVTRRAHTLVTAGPYHWVRHPFYVSGIILMLANGLAAANWFILAGALAMSILFRIRTGVEEARLVARFGDDYLQYMRHTGRFVPRLDRAPSSLTHSRA
jgi:protein-S-isoprenylcysteine O-methyltransferase Ste14